MGYNPRLVLVQPRKTHPYINERLLMGRKESNQTKWDSLAMNDNGTKFSLVVYSLSLNTAMGLFTPQILYMGTQLKWPICLYWPDSILSQGSCRTD